MKDSDIGVGCLVSWVPRTRFGSKFKRRYGIVVEVSKIRDYSSTYTLIKARSNDGSICSLDSREVHLHGKFAHRL
jgi:hypothetical protein